MVKTEHQETSSLADLADHAEQEILFTPAEFLMASQKVDLELDEIFGPSGLPDFPLVPQSPRKSIGWARIMQSPNPAQAQTNNPHTDAQLANTHQIPCVLTHPFYSYPDPSQLVNEAPVGPYFENAAPTYRAPYQGRQDSQRGAPFNQWSLPQNIPAPIQSPAQDPSRSALLRMETQTSYENSHIHPPSQPHEPDPQTPIKHESPQISSPSQPQFIRPDSDIKSPSNESKSSTSSQSGELTSDRTYSVEELERYLFENLQYWKPSAHNPKLGGLTLWIQRQPDYRSSATGCRLKCCIKGGTISADELRFAFDVQSRNCPCHDPRQNAGYVHLCCLERFLDFPKICIQLNVKGEDRVLGEERPKRNRMILQTPEEVDIVDRFVNFCSSNWRSPASYPAMDINTHTRPFQGTLFREIEILSIGYRRPALRRIWETQGIDGIMAERQRVSAKNLMMYFQKNQAKTKASANKGEKQARGPKLEPESESGSSSADGSRSKLKQRGKKRGRIEKPVQGNGVRKAVPRRNAKLKSPSRAMQSKQRSGKRGQAQKARPKIKRESVTSNCSSDSSFVPEPEKRGRKRAREHDLPAPRWESAEQGEQSRPSKRARR